RPSATILSRSWLVAATTRMSACTSSVPPSRRKRRSCRTRSSFTCIAAFISPISSRKIVPFSATSISPFLFASAPVKAPRMWPNSSDSRSVSGTPPQFNATNGCSRRSEAMLDVCRMLETIAKTSSTILITGESGTGKDLVARAIHYNSLRREHPFVALNCGGVPETLLESELFGHMRGAFTGADANKKGLIEVAEKGTIFLDEIGEMNAAMQVKLLRVLQDRRFRRLGGTEEVQADIRVVAATNQDLDKMGGDGGVGVDGVY